MSTPISHSERLCYYIRYQVSKYAEEMIEHTQSCRLPAFLDLGVSQLTSLVLRIFSIGELTTHGLELIFSPDRQLGKAMLKKASINTLKIPLDILNIIIRPCIMAFDASPKFYILWGVESIKVDIEHLEQGTIRSTDHKYDLNLALGRATTRIREQEDHTNRNDQENNPTPISHSERLDYRIQHQIFHYINEITGPGERLRPPALLALGSSNAAFFILRVFSMGELTIRGLGLVFSPDRELGKDMLKQVPIQVVQATLGLAISTIVNSCRIIKEPKSYIINNLERTQVDLQHARAGTLNSQSHRSDLQDARNRSKERLQQWARSS